MRLGSMLFCIAALLPAPALAGKLIEPHLHISPGGSTPQVALTLDACEGAVDLRILDALVNNSIPATIFVTGRWLKVNPDAIKVLVAHPELFELEDHGAQHIPAIIGTEKAYGLMPAGTAMKVTAEVQGGADAMVAYTGSRPHWFRGATALYSADALTLIHSLGLGVAGFSVNSDFGASSPAANVAKRIEAARDGDVIIAHINQPTHASGAGVVEGILALKAKGFRFVRLNDVDEVEE